MIQWHSLERALAAVLQRARGTPVVMFKCLLLRQWYTLPDP